MVKTMYLADIFEVCKKPKTRYRKLPTLRDDILSRFLDIECYTGGIIQAQVILIKFG